MVDPISIMPELPLTPPQDILVSANQTTRQPNSSPLDTGLALLAAERDGLAHLHNVYSQSALAQKGFSSAVDVLVSTTERGGRVVVSGIGKSGLIGRKLIATLNSLGLRAGWLHPTEALHGDLGMLGPKDALLLITFSGNTIELVSMMAHVPSVIPVILMTSAQPGEDQAVSDLPLFASRLNSVHKNNVLLPTPIPISEKELFGVSAPTVSTTVTLALGDALIMAAASKLHEHQAGVQATFKKYHPGGAIGKSNAVESKEAEYYGPLLSNHQPGAESPDSFGGSTVGDATDAETELATELELTAALFKAKAMSSETGTLAPSLDRKTEFVT